MRFLVIAAKLFFAGALLVVVMVGPARMSAALTDYAYSTGRMHWIKTVARPALIGGDADTQFKVGILYMHGDGGLPKDDAEAARYFRASAEQGFAKAQNNLAVALESGRGVPQNFDEAVEWYRKAADQKFILSQRRMGSLYARYRVDESDAAKAAEWLVAASDAGDPSALYRLSVAYVRGEGVVKDLEWSRSLRRRAAEGGHRGAQYWHGLWLIDTSAEEGLMWIHRAAEAGSTSAQWRLGLFYMNGRHVPKDHEAGFNWYVRAANAGDATAKRSVAEVLAEGRDGHPADPTAAMVWFKRAASTGDLDSLRTMGDIFAHGRYGFERNPEIAAEWYARAEAARRAAGG